MKHFPTPVRFAVCVLPLLAWAVAGLLANASADEPKPAPAPTPVPNSKPVEVPDEYLPYVYTDWEHFTVEDGLPNDHIFAVKVDGHRVWVGTEDGLACYDKRTGKFRAWKEADGLPFQVVSALDVDRKTGDLWIGLFGGGLARFTGGRFDHFDQLNSGLVNDVVYGVAVENDHVWAATTAGASRYNTVSKNWKIFTEKNAPMEEIWNYGVSYNDGKVYLAFGAAACWNSTSPPSVGTSTWIPTAKWRSTCTATTGSSTSSRREPVTSRRSCGSRRTSA
jgi:hypothetical protein